MNRVNHLFEAGMTLNLKPDNTRSGIQKIAFSVIAITQNNGFVELLTLKQDLVVIRSFPLESIKFTFGNNSPRVFSCFQWLTMTNVSALTTYDQYKSHLSIDAVSGTSSMVATLSNSSNSIKGMAITVLLMST